MESNSSPIFRFGVTIAKIESVPIFNIVEILFKILDGIDGEDPQRFEGECLATIFLPVYGGQPQRLGQTVPFIIDWGEMPGGNIKRAISPVPLQFPHDQLLGQGLAA